MITRKIIFLKEIKNTAKLCDLKTIRVHDLRHGHASLLIEMGFNILMISKRLGHKNIEATWKTYAHLSPDKDKQIAFGLEKVKVDGLSATHNPMAESQVLQLLSELKSSLPQNVNTYEDTEIIKWNIKR